MIQICKILDHRMISKFDRCSHKNWDSEIWCGPAFCCIQWHLHVSLLATSRAINVTLQERVHGLALEYAHQAFLRVFFGGNLHSSKILVPQKMDRLRMIGWCIYFIYLFLRRSFPPISWICSPLCTVSAFKFPGRWEAHQISTEKEALLRSLALLRERQKAPVAGTATRVGTTFWPIARWVLPEEWLAASFHGRENAVDFPC